MKKISRRRLRENVTGWLFVAPNLIGLTVFLLIPVVLTFFVSLTEWQFASGLSGMQWVGLDNFIALKDDIWFKDSLINNLIYSFVSVPITMILALFLAIILNKLVYGSKILRLFFFLPYISNMVAIAVVWFILYSETGPITVLIKAVFHLDKAPYWMADPQWALLGITIMMIWHGVGYVMVIFLAGLQNIPNDLYEAATVDGANVWQKFRNVTLPMLSPTTFFVLITTIISSFKIFSPVNVMTKGGPGTSTSVLVYYIYTAAFQFYKMGTASAVSVVMFAIIFIITVIQWKGQKKWVID